MDEHKPIELTITVSPHSTPRLHAELVALKAGRPRATVLKRLAEEYLLLTEQRDQLAGPHTCTLTNVSREIGSTDDGYSSQDNLAMLAGLNRYKSGQ